MTELDGFLAGWDASSSIMTDEYDIGEAVNPWFDIGNGGYDLVPPSVPRTPLYSAGTNGNPAVAFSRSASQFVGNENTWGGATQGITLYGAAYITYDFNSGGNYPLLTMGAYNTANVSEFLFIRPRKNQFVDNLQVTLAMRSYANTDPASTATERSMSNVNISVSDWPANTWVVFSAVWDGDGDRTLRFRVNGKEIRTLITTYSWHRWHPHFRMGHEGLLSNTQTWPGDIACLFVYDEDHDSETMLAAEDFLATKYGITL